MPASPVRIDRTTTLGYEWFTSPGLKNDLKGAEMLRCFVIQPFDKGKYDKRYEDIFKPAIEAAGLEAYRVDKDPSVDVPIDSIEEEIRNAAACLVDISTDNPNVWYELGYALANGKPVVMLCSDERTSKYPFDIQHRTISGYKAESRSDFDQLEKTITARLKALLDRSESLEAISQNDQVAPISGLSQPELAIIVAIAGELYMPDTIVAPFQVKNAIERSGFTSFAFTIGMRRLQSKGLVTTFEDNDGLFLKLTDKGWDWIEENEHRFTIVKPPKPQKPAKGSDSFYDDLPDGQEETPF